MAQAHEVLCRVPEGTGSSGLLGRKRGGNTVQVGLEPGYETLSAQLGSLDFGKKEALGCSEQERTVAFLRVSVKPRLKGSGTGSFVTG